MQGMNDRVEKLKAEAQERKVKKDIPYMFKRVLENTKLYEDNRPITRLRRGADEDDDHE